jgi:hypothetical protein
MTGLRLILKKSVVESIDSLDHELKDYFRESTRYRSRMRNGTIIIIDQTRELFDFLSKLVSQCQLQFRVIHLDSAKNARRVLFEIGPKNIKAVIVTTELLFASANGDTFAQWVNEQYPEIPVWVSQCSPDQENRVRRDSQRVGIMHEGSPLAEFIDVLGFPPSCREFAL